MDKIQKAPEATSRLGIYKILAKNASVRVSPLCLGTMSFGTAWESFVGSCPKEEAFNILDAFYKAGGNFVDTADSYQEGQSEQWIGEWMAKRKNREEMVIATKYTSPITPSSGGHIYINHSGNSYKSLKIAVERSLANLKTHYIDLLYIHFWDFTASIPEVMQSLHHLVASGTVLYLGVSDTPAWVVSAANTYARERNLTPFAVYQGKWNAEQRDFERDIIPMAKHFGMALAPWGVLGGGMYKKDEKSARVATPMFEQPNSEFINALDSLASELKATRSQVLIAYLIKKYPRTMPIIGQRKASYLTENICALEIADRMTQEHVGRLEKAAPLKLGFPHDMVGTGNYENNWFLTNGGKIQNLDP